MTFKVAVVGTGNVAQKNYLPFLARQQDITLSYYNKGIQHDLNSEEALVIFELNAKGAE